MMPQVFCMIDITPNWWATSKPELRAKAEQAIAQEDRSVFVYNEETRLQIGMFIRPDEVQAAKRKRQHIEMAVEYACCHG